MKSAYCELKLKVCQGNSQTFKNSVAILGGLPLICLRTFNGYTKWALVLTEIPNKLKLDSS